MKSEIFRIIFATWVTTSVAFAYPYLLMAAPQSAKTNGQSTTLTLGHYTRNQLETVLAAATDFRQIAIEDYQEALLTYGSQKAIRKFEQLDSYFWTVMPPKAGWSYFMSVSVYALGDINGRHPLVAFYNPWCDLYLITAWELSDTSVHLVDAEMLMGDFIRKSGVEPFDLIPAWVRTDTFKAVSPGLNAADAILAFEALFPPARNGDWRTKLPALIDKQFLEHINYFGARILLLQNLLNMAQFRSPQKKEEPALTLLRNATEKGLKLAARGKLKQLFKSANETIPKAKKALESIPPKTYDSLTPVAYYLGRNGGFVFMVSKASAGFFISFMVQNVTNRAPMAQGEKGTIKRIDVITYPGMYQYLTLTRDKAMNKKSGIK